MPQDRSNLDTHNFRTLLSNALDLRRPLIGETQAYRVFSGEADGVPGVFVDLYGQGAVLIIYEGTAPRGFNAEVEAGTVLALLAPLGARAVYLKIFAKDRSRLGGELPPGVTNPQPAAGEALPEAILIRENQWQLEIRLYDGLSTGLFLDQRANRAWVSRWVADRCRGNTSETAVLNTFAYTCAFSIAAAVGGTRNGVVGGVGTTSVDVSGRYLDWGKRSFAHNGIDIAAHRFARMDTFEFFAYAGRKGLRYDLIILDPPSFASGNKKKKIRPWSAASDYARLVSEASGLLKPRGVIFASTNTQDLCRAGRLEREIVKGIGRVPRWVELPAPPIDFARDQDRFAALAFMP
ncbi:MAG: class I SAM-dependent rRNA methyltransferase [Burkholderiales bacterium]|nr:class I SAM-dependent rRNA methyltransferase [Phycisphaerae bacterium]